MTPIVFHPFICRSDNYGLLLHDPATGATASIDAPDAEAIVAQLDARGWKLTHIFTTHHHQDHIEGNEALKRRFGCIIIGPRAESAQIPFIDQAVTGGDNIAWSGRILSVMDCPGHTAGHIAYHLPSDLAVFAGDTLFSLGCGRVFEGTMDQMYRSVSQFAKLPPETRLFCGHEYTKSNARFALSVEPGNAELQNRAAEVERLRAADKMTCPSTIGVELATNPFLRTGSAAIRQALKLEGASDAEVFGELRRRKDSFK